MAIWNPSADSEHPPLTEEQLVRRKRIKDRSELLRHIDHVIRPPAWVYEEIEEAIGHAIHGRPDAKIESRDGHRYEVADLVERWELDGELLDVDRRTVDDSDYEDTHYTDW